MLNFNEIVWSGSFDLGPGLGRQSVGVRFDEAWGRRLAEGAWWRSIGYLLNVQGLDGVVMGAGDGTDVELVRGEPAGPGILIDPVMFPDRERCVETLADVLFESWHSCGARTMKAVQCGLSAMYAWNAAGMGRERLSVLDLPLVLAGEGRGAGVIGWAVEAGVDWELERWARRWEGWHGKESVVSAVRANFGWMGFGERTRVGFRLEGDKGVGWTGTGELRVDGDAAAVGGVRVRMKVVVSDEPRS